MVGHFDSSDSWLMDGSKLSCLVKKSVDIAQALPYDISNGVT
jgi:hypothetical protein